MKRNHHTMESLRAMGYKIRVTHFRQTQNGLASNQEIRQRRDEFSLSPCGGRVVVAIETPQGEHVEAESECSRSDNFKRVIGTGIAFGRALKKLGLIQRASTAR